VAAAEEVRHLRLIVQFANPSGGHSCILHDGG